ncbi:MAG: caspase family protein [Deltaproteobacteria bacterium]|nr:caspase family protein [Deltaproteobacteria bacterium]
MKYRLWLMACFILLNMPCPAFAGAPPTTPFIRINTEMHSAKIMDIASYAAGKILATASFDKTVKIWEADSGRLIRTIRPPTGTDVEGALIAVALSPDGKSVATGGFTGHSWNKSYNIYLFDRQSGEMLKNISGLPQPVSKLLFSPDGTKLAIAFNNGSGVHVFETSGYRQIWKSERIKGNCLGMDYDNRGNLALTSDMGILRMYRPDGTLVYEQSSEDNKKIYSISFSPDASLLALGYDGHKPVEVRNAADGSRAFDLLQPPGGFSSVVWSADGNHILAAGNKQNSDSNKILCKWSVRSKSLEDQIILPTKDLIRQLVALRDGSLAFVARQNGFGVISDDKAGQQVEMSGKRGGKKKKQFSELTLKSGLAFYHPIATADFQKNHDSFKISADASSVMFSYERYGQAKALFDLKLRRLVTKEVSDTGLIAPRFTANGIDIQNWESKGKSSKPKLNRRELKGFWSREDTWSLAIRHDDAGFILGSTHNIRSYNKTGALLWQKRIPELVWDLNISSDNRIIAASMDDGTIRWYRLDDGRELYALYLHPDRKRWIIWTPDGYFDHGRDSESLIGFLVNRGADKAPTLIGIDRMYDIFYRPDIIDRAIAGEDISAYLSRLTAQSGTSLTTKAEPAAAEEKQIRKKPETVQPAKEQAEQEQIRQDEIKPVKTAPASEAAAVANGDQLPAYAPDANGDQIDVVQNPSLAGLLNSATLPPKVRFLSKSGSTGSRDYTLKAELCDNGGGIGNVTLFINDTPIAFERDGRGLEIRTKPASSPCQAFERVITLAPGRNNISLMAFNSSNTIESDRDQVTLDYLSTETEKPRLHILTIAVNSYRDGDLRLKYSINDAEGVIRAASDKAGTLFSGIDTYRLHDEQVTREKMGAIFSQIGARTRRGDVFLLFMAGHGLTDDSNGMYYFLPVDFRYTGLESLARQGISMNDFKSFLINIQAMKTLFLIDTCNSGSFSEAIASRGVSEKTALSKLARAVGRATIAASSKNQVALEGYEGHGVFSYTLLQGMNGKAADKKGEITINQLATFIEETLPELTFKKWGYEQIPQKSLIGSDFSIGVK